MTDIRAEIEMIVNCETRASDTVDLDLPRDSED